MAAPVPENVKTPVPCDDFMQFQNALKRMRLIDDRIVYALNTTLPTISFSDKVNATETCKDLYRQISQANAQRVAAIQVCLNKQSDIVNKIRAEKEKDEDNYDILKKLRKNQTQLRLMKSELDIERVLHEQTTKVFYERCRDSYRPPDL